MRAIRIFVAAASWSFAVASAPVAWAYNHHIDFIPPGAEERGVAPEFVIWIRGLWAAIENFDHEIHFFERQVGNNNRPLRYQSSASFAAGGYVSDVLSVQGDAVRVHLATGDIKDVRVVIPKVSDRAEAAVVTQEVLPAASLAGEAA